MSNIQIGDWIRRKGEPLSTPSIKVVAIVNGDYLCERRSLTDVNRQEWVSSTDAKPPEENDQCT